MLLYSLLHLTGYDLTLEDLRAFRQWGSITPGHPEHGLTPGVEATTGPLGQGVRRTRSGWPSRSDAWRREVNRPGHTLVDHRDVRDRLGRRPPGGRSRPRPRASPATSDSASSSYLYDDNHIQLDGPTSMAWSRGRPARFDAYGWHTQRVEDGNDVGASRRPSRPRRPDDRPSLIAVRTHIGYG